MTSHTITPARMGDLADLPATLTLPAAGRIGWGLGRAASYALNQAGLFPCPVLKVGERFHVRAADLLRALGLDPERVLTGAARPEPVGDLVGAVTE